MKTSTFIIAASAALVAAQDIKPFIPECSQKCLQDAAAKVSTCKLEPLDGKCICEPATFEKISGAAVSCVLAACGQDVAIGQVLPGSKKYCDSVAAGGGSGGGSGSSSSSSPPTAPTSAPTSKLPAPTTSSSSKLPTSAAPTTSHSSSASSPAKPTTGSPAGNGTTPSGKPSGPPVPAGAASASAGFVGLVAAVGLGILAL